MGRELKSKITNLMTSNPMNAKLDAKPNPIDKTLVSVITPTRLSPDRLDMLVELNQSLQLNHCEVEHIIVVDGSNQDAIPHQIRQQATIIGSSRSIGQAACRNLGLVVARGAWITSADDDDLLPPHSIDQRLQAIADQPNALWAAGYIKEKSDEQPQIMPAGPCAPGDVWRAWPTPNHSIPLGPTCLLVETNLLKRVGGWMGLSQGEDLGMMMAVTCTAPGILIDSCVYHYRMHGNQITKSPWFDELELLSRTCAWQRGEQILCQSSSPVTPMSDMLAMASSRPPG
jgi:glycosyltransferase involved in cell wall biosynthesis